MQSVFRYSNDIPPIGTKGLSIDFPLELRVFCQVVNDGKAALKGLEKPLAILPLRMIPAVTMGTFMATIGVQILHRSIARDNKETLVLRRP
jgi:hypothetical protein